MDAVQREPVRAAVATDTLTTSLRHYPLPPLGPDDGLLRVEAAAVGGTDWGIYRARAAARRPGPLILGRETVGRVAAIGERAADRWGVGAGDRIAVEEFPAGRDHGQENLPRYGSTPVSVRPSLFGGFAEYLYLHPGAVVHRVGERTDPELAALFAPLANGFSWLVGAGGLRAGETVVVNGLSRHGLGCVVAAREAGAGRVVVIGTPHDRRRFGVARALGADHVVDAGRDDPPAAVRGLTGGAGCDLVVDAVSGTAATVEDAVAMCARRGRVILAASKHGRPVSGFPQDLVVRHELTLRGVRGHDHGSVERALDVIRSGRHPLDLLCTNRFPLHAAHAALLTAGTRPTSGAIQVSVIP